MSIRKYRWYLIIVMLVVVLTGTLVYFFVADPDKTYKDGTLVQVQYASEEEFA